MADTNCSRCRGKADLRLLLEQRAVTSRELRRLNAEADSARRDLDLIDLRIAAVRDEG